ncbi:MAG: PilW family protein, partial [Kingella sp. (in: b-proteobacteria)]
MNKSQLFSMTKPSGFTLIEFLVASSLAVIVIIAATNTYLMTRQMNANTQTRLTIQQDLRNAGLMIARDVRNAGSFGCFSTATASNVFKTAKGINTDFPSISDRNLVLDNAQNNGFGVRVIEKADVNVKFMTDRSTAASDMLIVIYGKGSLGVKDTDLKGDGSPFTLKTSSKGGLVVNDYKNEVDISSTVTAKGDLVVSSCGNAYVAKATGGADGKIYFNGENANGLNQVTRAEVNVSKLYASGYVLSDVNGVRSLLRYDLDAAGNWQGPQLLASGIDSMTYQFGYVQSCGNAEEKSINKEGFQFSDTLNKKEVPAIVRLHLKYNTSAASTKKSNLADYIINATIRAGNWCASLHPS